MADQPPEMTGNPAAQGLSERIARLEERLDERENTQRERQDKQKAELLREVENNVVGDLRNEMTQIKTTLTNYLKTLVVGMIFGNLRQ